MYLFTVVFGLYWALSAQAQSPVSAPVEAKSKEQQLADLLAITDLAKATTLLQQSMELQEITGKALQSRVDFVNISGTPTKGFWVIGASLSYLLGGKVVFKDDSSGEFFNSESGEQFSIRTRSDDLWSAEDLIDGGRGAAQRDDRPYATLGGLKAMIALAYLRRLSHVYGLLKDYGIKNLTLEYKSRAKGSISIKSDTMHIVVGYRQHNVDAGSVTEEFNVSGLQPYFVMTNWWKYREYDSRSVLTMVQGLPRFQWGRSVRTLLLSIGGAVIPTGAGSNADPVMFVTPTIDPKVENYYLQVTWPDMAAIETALIDKGQRIRHDYPRSFIIEDLARFSLMFSTVQGQTATLSEEEQRLLAETDFAALSEEKNLNDAQKRELLVNARLRAFFEGKDINLAKKTINSMSKATQEQVKTWVPSDWFTTPEEGK